MIFCETKLKGVFRVGLEVKPDERGFFARYWCQRESKLHGLDATVAQCSISFNGKKGTLRGMHYQEPPYGETKIVRCTMGSVFDVVLDLRPQSQTFKQWISVTLTATNRDMVYVPKGCAHGFLTLEDTTEVCYQMSEFYNAEAARGVRWDDPAFQISWPSGVEVISERDRTYPDFE